MFHNILVLRFKSFGHALFAKRVLEGNIVGEDEESPAFTIGDRKPSVEFSPRRLAFVQFDGNQRQFRPVPVKGEEEGAPPTL